MNSHFLIRLNLSMLKCLMNCFAQVSRRNSGILFFTKKGHRKHKRKHCSAIELCQFSRVTYERRPEKKESGNLKIALYFAIERGLKFSLPGLSCVPAGTRDEPPNHRGRLAKGRTIRKLSGGGVLKLFPQGKIK